MTTYTIELDDYHPGEITGFESSGACRDRRIWENGHWPGHCYQDADDFGTDIEGNTGSPNCITLLGMRVDMLSVDDEGNLVDEDADDRTMTRWVLTGTASQLRQAYQELLAALSEPAWHWYGMGGDDYCYDYWPNTMRLAADFRDKLYDVADKGAWDALYNTQYLADDLCHIYWLARTRYARSNDAAGVDTAEGVRPSNDEYFEMDILSHEDFGDCPAWLAR